ncbi:MAG: ribonuclease HI family protein [Candidatus Andersenbacteria bacterium]|nr:ribonuclease HI family protein [bacterium]MDZ4225606.1 ribonuclease HI family protein [Candidatus Andersenbacteria bacterium]
MSKKATLFTDGGARGNPGPAGIGLVLRVEGEQALEYGEYIGETTNNQAEYKALIKGLAMALEAGVSEIKCFLDSQLVVEQLKGNYRVKNNGLKQLFVEAKELADKFETTSFTHVTRDKNKIADRLVNEALDREK